MSADPIAAGLLSYFDSLVDPRSPKGVRHSLRTILTISFVGMICGADGPKLFKSAFCPELNRLLK